MRGERGEKYWLLCKDDTTKQSFENCLIHQKWNNVFLFTITHFGILIVLTSMYSIVVMTGNNGKNNGYLMLVQEIRCNDVDKNQAVKLNVSRWSWPDPAVQGRPEGTDLGAPGGGCSLSWQSRAKPSNPPADLSPHGHGPEVGSGCRGRRHCLPRCRLPRHRLLERRRGKIGGNSVPAKVDKR